MAGFVKTNMDIKIMVLYALSEFHEPPTFEELSQVLLCDEGVNYFLLTQSVDELLLPKNIVMENHRYHLTKRGKDNLKECLLQMPASVQKKCDDALIRINRQQDKRKFVKTDITDKIDGSVLLRLTLLDETGILFDTNMMIPTRREAEVIAQSFWEDSTTFFYALRDRAVALTAPPPSM